MEGGLWSYLKRYWDRFSSLSRGGLTLSDELMGVGWVGREMEKRRVGKLGLV